MEFFHDFMDSCFPHRTRLGALADSNETGERWLCIDEDHLTKEEDAALLLDEESIPVPAGANRLKTEYGRPI